MFVTGETEVELRKGKLGLPKEFHLRNKELYGCWEREDRLVLSDNPKALTMAVGTSKDVHTYRVGNDSSIQLSKDFQDCMARIYGNVSTIDITIFQRESE